MGARSLRQIALSHRDAARVLAATAPSGPHRLRAIDALLGLLIRAGFPPADAADAGYLLNVYIVGFMLDEALGPQPPTAPAGSGVAREILEMPEQGQPHSGAWSGELDHPVGGVAHALPDDL